MRWNDDPLGLTLVLLPIGTGLLQAAAIGAHCMGRDARSGIALVLGFAMLMACQAVATVDARRQGRTASLLVLFLWVVGYPLYMRQRGRRGAHFGLGSGLFALAGWGAALFGGTAVLG